MNEETKLSEKRMIFLDLETTGLSVVTDKIIEVGAIVTDGNLQVIAELPSLVIHRTPEELDSMEPICRKMHKYSGLFYEVESSTLTQEQAEDLLLGFLKANAMEQTSPLVGFSVHFDYKFLERHMPKVYEFFPHQLLDISSLRVATRLWAPKYENQIARFKRVSEHRAYKDCQDALRVLKFYRENLFRE